MEMQSYRTPFRILIRLVGVVLHAMAVMLSCCAKATDWVADRCASKPCIYLDTHMESFWGAMPVVARSQEQKKLRSEQLRHKTTEGARPNWVK